MKVGDLVRLKSIVATQDSDSYGIVLDIHTSRSYMHMSEDYHKLIEYQVSLVNSSKPAWYIEDALELVNEAGGFD